MTIVERLAVLAFLGAIVSVYALELVLVTLSLVGKFTSHNTAVMFWSKPAVLLHIVAAIGIICFIYGYFVEPYRIEVNTVKIKTPKLPHTSLRIVHLSDTHCDTKPRNEPRLIEMVNRLDADIIVFTGDTLNIATPQALPLFKQTMGDLKAKTGKFAVRGNVDVWYLPDLDFFGGTGFELLDANSIKLQKDGDTFYISGISCEHPGHLKGVLKDVPEDSFSILLYHYADFAEDLNGLNVDLYLCGHTHGGQVRLPFFGALTTLSKFGKKYEAGMYKVGKMTLYVNRGIGLEGGVIPKVRFLTRPEITVFDIISK